MRIPILRLAALWLIGVVGLGACGDDSPFRFVDVSVDIDRQTVPGFLSPLLTNCDQISEILIGPDTALLPFSVDFADEAELEGVDLTFLEQVVLDRIVLQIVDEAAGGDEDDFDFVNAIRIFADDPNDAAPEVLIAELDPVPSGQDRVVVPGTGVDLREIADDDFIVRGELEGFLPCDDVHFVGELEFDVQLF